MHIHKECLECLQAQACQALKLTQETQGALKTPEAPEAPETQSVIQATTQAVDVLLSRASGVLAPPPRVAIDVYSTIASLTQNPDIYQSIKAACIQKARQITDQMRQNLPHFPTPLSRLVWALKAAALGNVIDYGSATHFDIHQYAFDMDCLDFARFDLESFAACIESAKSLVYIGDNAGENLFDELLIETLKALYPELKIVYFVRGAPIINDITLKDLSIHAANRIFELCEVLDSGVPSPGFIYELANPLAQSAFDRADVILAKGMGNFECLESIKDSRIFLLFKIKCQVVAKFLDLPLGKMIFQQNTD
ncbi:hypothetical protein BKH46_04535 [Helicobacter sp. 12S02634-8]|uniref:damage-control phosphatase ARMT1 family protein n=1 Tax=Helicobacter sp. 12S02634-8 TaxID=1476199 RepID=UPI000BA51288|nr:ARMT1-like domain-containing protein [Helicobacter sp. 12S02634-8]PAF47353.1 hypothetical protein BKH46_04535 [Helicobacter sp. 12S02634-8]